MVMLFAGTETGVHCEIRVIPLQGILANAMYGGNVIDGLLSLRA